MYRVTNPATGEQDKPFVLSSNLEIEETLLLAEKHYKQWKKTKVEQRAKYLYQVVALYDQRKSKLAEIVTKEMGKPISQALLEIEITKEIFKYYADNSEFFLAEEHLPIQNGKATIIREGLGVLFGIMPWNYPHYQVARFAAPNLINGNTIILKHAPQCPETAKEIEKIFLDSGLPPGVYNNVFASHEQAEKIIKNQIIQGVSLTGSEVAGSAVAEIAGKHLKKIVLELGGSDPFLVLADADLDKAVEHAVIGRFANAGQACNAAKRLIVHQDIYHAFTTRFCKKVASIKPKNPLDPTTFLGPVSSILAAQKLQNQVNRAIKEGANVLLKGGRMAKLGAWFSPVILADVDSSMAIYHEEVFGPVAVIYKATSQTEAVKLANDSDYGLGAVIHTKDQAKAYAIAKQLNCGMVYINEAPGSSADLPFGGIKKSGFGRELGQLGMDEFVNKKIIRF